MQPSIIARVKSISSARSNLIKSVFDAFKYIFHIHLSSGAFKINEPVHEISNNVL